jgi:serine acetyltransferase
VTVGAGAVIAASAVVASDVPAYWNWPIGKITEHVRTIRAGRPAAERAGVAR